MDIKKLWSNVLGIVTLGLSKKEEFKAVYKEFTDVIVKYKLAKADGKVTKLEMVGIMDEIIDVYEALKVVI